MANSDPSPITIEKRSENLKKKSFLCTLKSTLSKTENRVSSFFRKNLRYLPTLYLLRLSVQSFPEKAPMYLNLPRISLTLLKPSGKSKPEKRGYYTSFGVF